MLALSRRTLSELPAPSPDIFALRAPWSPLSARTLTNTLNIDHGLLAVWRMRGLGPKALPAEWTKGHRHAYRVDAALAWLADRAGEPFDQRAAWLDHLAAVHMPRDLVWVRQMAERDGPSIADGDVVFTKGGFSSYLNSLTM